MRLLTEDELAAAIADIPDGATVATTGAGGGLLEPEALLSAFERAFLCTGRPRGLTFVHALGLGDRSVRGCNRFAHEGMVRRVIGGHWVWSPRMLQMARENRIEAYCFPGGVIAQLLREIGAGRPGLFTHVGLGTFVDPRLGGGRCNAVTTEELVELLHIDGREVLRYRPFPVHVGIVRGTYTDADGNISAAEEPADLDAYEVALAARNSGGRVFAQVREVRPRGSLRPREICIPGNLVDYVLPCPDQAQTYHGPYDLALAGLGAPLPAAAEGGIADPLRRIVAERAAQELVPGSVVNFGFGMSSDVATVIARAGEAGRYWFTIEQGLHNGTLLTGDLFGIASMPAAIVPSTRQFDLYSGGGLDQTFLGMAELDRHGNVNVSHIAGQASGPGGFIDISQGAKSVVFCGSFATKGLRLDVSEGRLRIATHGEVPKLVDAVAAITFSGAEAVRRGQRVLYVTERAVFRLTPEGVELIEVAPGLDIRADILERMGFAPIVRALRPMDARLFRREPEQLEAA
jgi:propionate CoA-transferase